MYVKKNFGLKSILVFSGGHIIWITIWALLIALVYQFTSLKEWLVIPWLPLSVIGTAVAFYVSFKNNSAYDRLWEARKIWGAIVYDTNGYLNEWEVTFNGEPLPVATYYFVFQTAEEQSRKHSGYISILK